MKGLVNKKVSRLITFKRDLRIKIRLLIIHKNSNICYSFIRTKENKTNKMNQCNLIRQFKLISLCPTTKNYTKILINYYLQNEKKTKTKLVLKKKPFGVITTTPLNKNN